MGYLVFLTKPWYNFPHIEMKILEEIVLLNIIGFIPITDTEGNIINNIEHKKDNRSR